MAARLVKKCVMCDKKLPPLRRMFCTDRCSNKANAIRKYGLSVEDYRTLVGDGTCPICKRRMRKVNIDHDWKTGLVRGAICGTCNQRILTALTEPIQAFGLLEYLTTPPAMLLDGPRKVGPLIEARQNKKKYWR